MRGAELFSSFLCGWRMASAADRIDCKGKQHVATLLPPLRFAGLQLFAAFTKLHARHEGHATSHRSPMTLHAWLAVVVCDTELTAELVKECGFVEASPELVEVESWLAAACRRVTLRHSHPDACREATHLALITTLRRASRRAGDAHPTARADGSRGFRPRLAGQTSSCVRAMDQAAEALPAADSGASGPARGNACSSSTYPLGVVGRIGRAPSFAAELRSVEVPMSSTSEVELSGFSWRCALGRWVTLPPMHFSTRSLHDAWGHMCRKLHDDCLHDATVHARVQHPAVAAQLRLLCLRRSVDAGSGASGVVLVLRRALLGRRVSGIRWLRLLPTLTTSPDSWVVVCSVGERGVTASVLGPRAWALLSGYGSAYCRMGAVLAACTSTEGLQLLGQGLHGAAARRVFERVLSRVDDGAEEFRFMDLFAGVSMAGMIVESMVGSRFRFVAAAECMQRVLRCLQAGWGDEIGLVCPSAHRASDVEALAAQRGVHFAFLGWRCTPFSAARRSKRLRSGAVTASIDPGRIEVALKELRMALEPLVRVQPKCIGLENVARLAGPALREVWLRIEEMLGCAFPAYEWEHFIECPVAAAGAFGPRRRLWVLGYLRCGPTALELQRLAALDSVSITAGETPAPWRSRVTRSRAHGAGAAPVSPPTSPPGSDDGSDLDPELPGAWCSLGAAEVPAGSWAAWELLCSHCSWAFDGATRVAAAPEGLSLLAQVAADAATSRSSTPEGFRRLRWDSGLGSPSPFQSPFRSSEAESPFACCQWSGRASTPRELRRAPPEPSRGAGRRDFYGDAHSPSYSSSVVYEDSSVGRQSRICWSDGSSRSASSQADAIDGGSPLLTAAQMTELPSNWCTIRRLSTRNLGRHHHHAVRFEPMGSGFLTGHPCLGVSEESRSYEASTSSAGSLRSTLQDGAADDVFVRGTLVEIFLGYKPFDVHWWCEGIDLDVHGPPGLLRGRVAHGPILEADGSGLLLVLWLDGVHWSVPGLDGFPPEPVFWVELRVPTRITRAELEEFMWRQGPPDASWLQEIPAAHLDHLEFWF